MGLEPRPCEAGCWCQATWAGSRVVCWGKSHDCGGAQASSTCHTPKAEELTAGPWRRCLAVSLPHPCPPPLLTPTCAVPGSVCSLSLSQAREAGHVCKGVAPGSTMQAVPEQSEQPDSWACPAHSCLNSVLPHWLPPCQLFHTVGPWDTCPPAGFIPYEMACLESGCPGTRPHVGVHLHGAFVRLWQHGWDRRGPAGWWRPARATQPWVS